MREPSSILQAFRDHLALIVKPTSCEDRPPLSEVDLAGLEALQIPPQLYRCIHLHRLQPFDPLGFVSDRPVRFKINGLRSLHRFSRSKESGRHGEYRYPVEHDEMLILNSQQWIQDVAFPARLYLKTLGWKI